MKFIKQYPKMETYITFDAPNYILRVGDFTEKNDAERFKKEHGYVWNLYQDFEDEAEIESVHGNGMHVVSKKTASYILQARALELFVLLQDDIKRSSLASLMTAGLVLTGGGALLPGMDDLAKKVLGMPVRIGKPRVDCSLSSTLSNPMHATGYGLLKYALRKDKQVGIDQMEGPMVQRVFTKMRSWIDKFF